jgi:hypothetical protein
VRIGDKINNSVHNLQNMILVEDGSIMQLKIMLKDGVLIANSAIIESLTKNFPLISLRSDTE